MTVDPRSSAGSSPNNKDKLDPLEIAVSNARFSGLTFHAAGGLGEVYRADDESLHREVALKFIQRRHEHNQEHVSLFLLEAEITSRLNHPGVVPVFCVGKSSVTKRPFYAMRFIEGIHLRKAIEEYHRQGEARLELHRLLTHLIAVCNTVAYAHNRGVVHCDIKPENIMLGKFGETLLVDWGLATKVERDERARASGEQTLRFTVDMDSGISGGSGSSSSPASSGSNSGTLGYMSPEQHPGHRRAITPASDIYSLGATLYCVLTGRASLIGPEETLLLDNLRMGKFPKPSEVNPKTPRVLEAICLKAMEPKPGDRYPTVLALANDLEAFLADEKVSVYREGFYERLVRAGRRHRNWVISGVLATCLVLLVTIGAAMALGYTAQRETKARQDAEVARQDSEAACAAAKTAEIDGMRLAARFAAKAVAGEIDLRWRILSLEAADSTLPPLLQALTDKTVDSPPQRALQKWLETRRAAHPTEAESWFLLDARGVQVARVPFSEESIFKNYSDRSYFDGGRLDPNAAASATNVKPIMTPRLSSVYLSTSTQSLKVAFSVPVWKDGKPTSECIGVLGMSIELGAFRELQTSLQAGQIAALIELRTDQAEKDAARGLILHHPALADALRRRAADGNRKLFRIPSNLVDRLEQLRQTRVDEILPGEVVVTAHAPAPGSVDMTYVDPLAPDAGTVIAAFEPVRIESRPLALRDTGWVVVVQEAPPVTPSRPTP